MTMNTERAVLRTMPGKRACTAVGAVAMAVGAVVVASGSETFRQYRSEILWKGAEIVGMALGTVSALLAVLYVMGAVYDRWTALSIRLLKAAGITFAAALAVVTVLGWARFFGFDSVGGPAIGSVPVGIGCAALAAGVTILAWCWTPEDEDSPFTLPFGGRNGNKAYAAALATVFVFAFPGLMATIPERQGSGERPVASAPAGTVAKPAAD